MQELVIATSNPGKIKEFSKILGLKNYTFLSLKDIGFTEDILEDGDSFDENAFIKARTVYDFCGKSTLADDSGLCVEALGGAPGIFSARYAGEPSDDFANNEKLQHELSSSSNRDAHFHCSLAFIDEEGQEYLFEGKSFGEILETPRGNLGFGYDPYFQPQGYNLSFAEMSTEQKKQISHRGFAIQELQKHLNK